MGEGCDPGGSGLPTPVVEVEVEVGERCHSGVAVEAVVARWGFGGPPRFDTQYRTPHGGTPTATCYR